MKLLIAWVLNALAFIATAYIVPGFYVSSFTTALIAAAVMAVINTFVKPVLVILTLPLTIVTLGLFLLIVNAIGLWLVTVFVPGVSSSSALTTILAALVLAIISTILSSLAGLKNDK